LKVKTELKETKRATKATVGVITKLAATKSKTLKKQKTVHPEPEPEKVEYPETPVEETGSKEGATEINRDSLNLKFMGLVLNKVLEPKVEDYDEDSKNLVKDLNPENGTP